MTAITNALTKSNALINTAYSRGLALKQSNFSTSSMVAPGASFGVDRYLNHGGNKSRYALNRNWVYSAINAIAIEAAGQPVNLARLLGSETPSAPSIRQKGSKYLRSTMTDGIHSKSADTELERIQSHPLLEALRAPNGIQNRWAFVHSFISNLALTGWGFVIGGIGEDGKYEFFSVPTTWVEPDHSEGAFTKIKIINPRDPSSKDNEPLTRENFAFAYLPDPSDPLKSLSPSQAEFEAIKIDDNIQSSQRVFFDNGVFPSVIVTVGSNPHPDVPGGIRPRLTAKQRRQVYSAIRKTMSGVANYGNPAIVDGIIEKVQRFSATQQEMGWDRSEDKVRLRILSAFGVHPFILGEKMPGSYAQAYAIQDRFCKRVNTYLDLLSLVMTTLGPPLAAEQGQELLLWWEKCKAEDPQLDHQIWRGARERGDVTQNEFRAYMGMPPDEDKQQAEILHNIVRPVIHIASEVNKGMLQVEQGIAILEGLGIPTDTSKKIVGKGELEDSQIEILETLQQLTARLANLGGTQGSAARVGGADTSEEMEEDIAGE